MIMKPDYYKTESGVEAIDFIEAYDLNFCLLHADELFSRLVSVAKCIARAGKKGRWLDDLLKKENGNDESKKS